MKRKMILWAPLAIVGFAVFIAIGGAIVRALWNWLAPSLFHAPQITFWQAIGLLALSRILFGHFGLNGGRRGGRWRMQRERWDKMTPEERERFREHVTSS